ncbi:hypothetical protein HJA62_004332 [Vibrio vulnificus]|nr:hypothetical protein [Vibrio vulnificus]
MEDLEKKLAEYVTNIKLAYSIQIGCNFDFPSKKSLSKCKNAQLNILVEQAEKLLNCKNDFSIFGNEIGNKDRDGLIKVFIEDLEQFATLNNVAIGSGFIASYSQSRISDHAFFHLASCSILPKSYETIDLNEHEHTFNIYSVPFKLRVAIENKLKSIIGFVSCDLSRNGLVQSGLRDFPVSMVIQELIKLKCLNLPCSLENISNVYSWSCSFCHTGEKEYLWMSMKAIETLSGLFLYESQIKYKIGINELWHKYVLSPDYLIEEMIRYKGVSSPLYYIKKGWSIKKLESSLNQTKNRSLSPYTFHLSEVELDGSSAFYCSSTNTHV